MDVLSTVTACRSLFERRGPGVLIPTMGGLHDGHLTLVEAAVRARSERSLPGPVVVSVFVNPTQFDEAQDYERYPRDVSSDAALCASAGAEIVFAPSVDEMYPPGATAEPMDPLPGEAVDQGLEDAHRPGHFEGVCQVVERLFRVVTPGVAVFGEKDWQQFRVVSAMSQSLGLGVEVIPSTTVRERDGLAMSSRNRFLSPGERAAGLCLSRAIRAAQGAPSVSIAESIMRDVFDSAGVEPDYATVRDAQTLDAGVWPSDRPMRAIVAGRLGETRLLDNAPWVGGRAEATGGV